MDSRQQYALGPHTPAIFLPWKQRTSALRRGKDMVYSGKAILKVTTVVVVVDDDDDDGGGGGGV